jgi:formylglycine-generating enzyme required for sulfatase activity
VERRVAAHPRGAELGAVEAELGARRAEEAVRTGRAAPPVVDLELASLPASALELNELAWARVDPERIAFGREGEGLALARLALERADPMERPLVLDTLAWASLACGLDDDALQASRDALAEAQPGDPRFPEYLARVTREVRHARETARRAEIAAAATRLAALQREVLGTTLPRFASEDDRWWHAQLEQLVARIEAFADPERGLVTGTSPEHGWGIERRLEHARGLEEATRRGAEARARWDAARAEIRDPARSPAYAGLELAPQLGLVPLGRDPHSGLHEFADTATGTPPRRGPDGRLALAGESSVVFVLVPGGRARIGAQSHDPLGANHDPAAQPDEQPVHEILLAPFFLAKHELTQGQWRRFAGSSPSKYLAGTTDVDTELGEDSPLEQVSWETASRVLARLGWDLPTEAQWEYAARAGSGTPWWTGEEPGSLQGTCNLADRFARDQGAPWDASLQLDDGHFLHAAAGSFAANPFGLQDTIGNVFEWCRDRYGDYSLPVASGDGERIGGNPATRVLRGGSYMTAALWARSARRDSASPGLADETLGVRPMRRVEE